MWWQVLLITVAGRQKEERFKPQLHGVLEASLSYMGTYVKNTPKGKSKPADGFLLPVHGRTGHSPNDH